MYWSETGKRIRHDMAKDSIVFWDATGFVISPRIDRPRFYNYELACLNPTKDQNIIAVTSLLSTLHSTPMIRFWTSEFRKAQKILFGHGNIIIIAIPKKFNSDRILVFIQAALSEFNNEMMDDYKSRAWRIINGEASCCDMSKVNLHACLSHAISSFKKIIKDVFKSKSEFGMFFLRLILISRNLNDMKENIYRVLLSKSLDPETEVVLKILNKKPSKLRSSDDKELENSEILIYTDSIFPEFA